VFLPLAMLSQYVFGPALFLISLFIVLIILLQRGRGGGLTGALGGAGGASAFGVKAGDIFTRITATAVLLWIVLCAVTCYWYLPDSLNIATNPSAMSSGASGAMGGMGGIGSAEGVNLSSPDNAKPDASAADVKSVPAEGSGPSNPTSIPEAPSIPQVPAEAPASEDPKP